MVKEAQMENAEIKNLLLFCSIELVAFWAVNGIFWMRFSIFRGRDFLFASLLIEASLGVILKIEIEASKVAKTASNNKETLLIKMTGILNELPIKGMQYVFIIEWAIKEDTPYPIGIEMRIAIKAINKEKASST